MCDFIYPEKCDLESSKTETSVKCRQGLNRRQSEQITAMHEEASGKPGTHMIIKVYTLRLTLLDPQDLASTDARLVHYSAPTHSLDHDLGCGPSPSLELTIYLATTPTFGEFFSTHCHYRAFSLSHDGLSPMTIPHQHIH